MSRSVSRADRVVDLAATAVVVAGAVAYLYALAGMRALAAHPSADHPGGTAMQRFDHYWQMSRLALGLFACGVVALAYSFWRHHRRPHPLP